MLSVEELTGKGEGEGRTGRGGNLREGRRVRGKRSGEGEGEEKERGGREVREGMGLRGRRGEEREGGRGWREGSGWGVRMPQRSNFS